MRKIALNAHVVRATRRDKEAEMAMEKNTHTHTSIELFDLFNSTNIDGTVIDTRH